MKNIKTFIQKNLVILLLITSLTGVVLDLGISGVLWRSNTRLNHLASSQHQLKAGAYEACLTSNNKAAADLNRWNRILVLINTMPKDKAEQTFVRGVDAANKAADAPIDCAKLKP